MILRKGSKGTEVRCLQENLKAIGFYDFKVDGHFGNLTMTAVTRFQRRYFVDGIADEYTQKSIEEAVVAWARRDLNILVTVPKGLKEIRSMFGHFDWNDEAAGYITIEDKWLVDNLKDVDLPVVGRMTIHKKLERVFCSVLEDIKDKGLDREIKTFGTFCPRHKFHDPGKRLSAHSWGIACDVNQATNLPGTNGDLDRDIITSFERHGFEWGGSWRYRDPMHFQYCSLY